MQKTRAGQAVLIAAIIATVINISTEPSADTPAIVVFAYHYSLIYQHILTTAGKVLIFASIIGYSRDERANLKLRLVFFVWFMYEIYQLLLLRNSGWRHLALQNAVLAILFIPLIIVLAVTLPMPAAELRVKLVLLLALALPPTLEVFATRLLETTTWRTVIYAGFHLIDLVLWLLLGQITTDKTRTKVNADEDLLYTKHRGSTQKKY